MSEKYPPVADPLFRVWVVEHATRWSQAEDPIGLSSEQIAEYGILQQELADAWNQYALAQSQVRTAHDHWMRTKARVRAVTMDDLGAIRRFAEASPNPLNVYNEASIPAPKERTLGREPGRPVRVRAELKSQGGAGGWSIVLRWDCRNPKTTAGTVYTVERSEDNGASWLQIGIVSRRSFTDAEAPGTAAQLFYRVTALRSGIAGEPSDALAVKWGSNTDQAGEQRGGRNAEKLAA